MSKQDMSSKKKHHWIVQLQRGSDGQMGPYDFWCNWNPEQEGAREAVERSAAAQAWWESGKKIEYAALSSELVGPQELAAAA